MARHDEDPFQLGTATMKRLNEMYGRDGITSKDIKAAKADGMGHMEMQKQYRQHVADGGRVHQGAQARMEGLRTYDSLDDFDHDHIAGRNLNPDNNRRRIDVSGLEMINLLKNNEFDAREVNQMVKDRNLSLGNRAQNQLNKALAKLGATMPTDITDPGDGTPVIDTTPPLNVAQQEQKFDGTMEMPQEFTQGSDKFNDSPVTNTFGDNANIYGNYTGGNVDMGIYIGAQKGTQGIAGGLGSGAVTVRDGGRSGAMGLGGGGLDNFGSAAATLGLLENGLARQNQMFSASGLAKSAIDASARDTDSVNRLNKLNYLYAYPGYNEAKANQIGANYLGDLDAFKVPDWKSTADPEKYDLDDLEKVANKYKV